MHHGPTRIHLADYSLRHRRDGNAGTTILYHPRIYRRPHSSSVMSAGRRSCWWMGTAATSAGAAGPSKGLRAGRSSGRTKPEYTAASGRHDHATTGAGRHVSPTTGTRSQSRQTTFYVRRRTGRVPGSGTLLIIYSALLFTAQVTEVGTMKDIAATPTS